MEEIKNRILEALYSLPAILIGLSFHEWGHAYAAYKRGDPTARNLGRMTVNPLAHIDPVGFLSLLILGFGWAKPVPVSTRNFKSPKKDELIVSLAGVTVNLILGVIFLILYVIFGFLPWYSDIVSIMLQYCFMINFGLMVFNLLPIPPLDGYHVVQCLFMNQRTYRFFNFVEKYSYVILIGVLLLNSRTGLLNALQAYFSLLPLKGRKIRLFFFGQVSVQSYQLGKTVMDSVPVVQLFVLIIPICKVNSLAVTVYKTAAAVQIGMGVTADTIFVFQKLYGGLRTGLRLIESIDAELSLAEPAAPA